MCRTKLGHDNRDHSIIAVNVHTQAAPRQVSSPNVTTSIAIFLQQPLHRLNLILEPLLLIRPRSNPDVALDPHHPVLMQHGMALTDDSHHIVPRALYQSLSAVPHSWTPHRARRPSPSPAENA